MRPPLLHPGDRVAFAAPARSASPEMLHPALQLLQSWGLQPVVPPQLFDTWGQLAGSDDTRAALMQQLLDAPDIHAIFCVRGGYGTVRIIDRLDFSRFAQHPKWIVGYSDITVLHSHIHCHTGIETLHATMPIDLPTDASHHPCSAIETLRQALFEGHTHLQASTHPLNRTGEAFAPLVGGNLSILYSLCGSSSDIDTTGKILLIEDLDEYLYHIDRMMMNLRRNGHLSHLAGLVVGGLNNMHDNAVPFGRTAEQIILDAVQDYGYPVCFNLPVGHIGTDNHALILGAPARLTVASHGTRLEQ